MLAVQLQESCVYPFLRTRPADNIGEMFLPLSNVSLSPRTFSFPLHLDEPRGLAGKLFGVLMARKSKGEMDAHSFVTKRLKQLKKKG